MISQSTIFWSTIVYVLLFIICVVGFGVFRIKARKERVPVDFKLLRGPGETLRRKIAKADEAEFLVVVLTVLAPVLVALGFLNLVAKLAPTTPLKPALIVTGIIFVAAMFVSARVILKRLHRYRSDWLGYMGERVVGETLMELTRRGYYVFHDVPAEGASKPFNLDHVVIGPSGVWLIETKTRRKGRARPGYKDHEVTFDGTKLIWPWGEDTHGIEQARFEAQWLTKWIHQHTGQNVVARPILALPGWFVHEKTLGPVRVLNHKNLCSAIIGRGQSSLSSDQIDLIARQLDRVCRDVDE